ncbi:neutral ceramidase [Trichonephila clavipes]|nr:neutral ceramidase [Trichonephila clavipes]
MGFSFAAGTIDCPGEFDFLQGTTKGSTLWNIVVDFIRRPSKELRACQAPKPILLATGEAGFTASAHAENEGVNELLRHCCPFVAAPIEAPESLLVVRYELPSVCLENPIHARWD